MKIPTTVILGLDVQAWYENDPLVWLSQKDRGVAFSAEFKFKFIKVKSTFVLGNTDYRHPRA